MAYILSLDQGTTSSRAILFDHSGAIVTVAQQEFQQFYPKPGWVEHDPTEILTSQMSCAVQALVRAGIEAHDVAALGITNQRETVIVWDRETGQPVYNAIVWQDRRGAGHCERLVAEGVQHILDGIHHNLRLIDFHRVETALRLQLRGAAGERDQRALQTTVPAR